MTTPAILIDVDGPLNPYGRKWQKPLEGYERHLMRPDSWTDPRPLRVRLSPLHGPAFMQTGAELIWATTWEEEANEWIGPHIGLPKLPVIDWIDKDYWNPEKLYWKTKRIVSWMNENRPGVPYVWIDDECTERDSKYLAENSTAEAWTMRIHPSIGLVAANFEQLRLWTEKYQ